MEKYLNLEGLRHFKEKQDAKNLNEFIRKEDFNLDDLEGLDLSTISEEEIVEAFSGGTGGDLSTLLEIINNLKNEVDSLKALNLKNEVDSLKALIDTANSIVACGKESLDCSSGSANTTVYIRDKGDISNCIPIVCSAGGRPSDVSCTVQIGTNGIVLYAKDSAKAASVSIYWAVIRPYLLSGN